LDTSYYHPTAGSTLSPAGHEFNEKEPDNINVSTMDWLKDLVDDEGLNGTTEQSESE
jgi:hypothetical protein